jgi:hypothetical protein
VRFNRNPAYPRSGDPNSFSAPRLQAPIPANPGAPSVKPGVRLDRMASGSGSMLQGQVVSADQVPQANAKVVFISTAAERTQRQITTDASGRFQVNLASGGWLVYVVGADGRHTFHQKIEVGGREVPLVKLVSR